MALMPGYCLSPRQFCWRNCCHRCNGSDEKMQMLLSGFSAKSFFNPWKLRRRAIHCSELDNSQASTAPEGVSEGTTVSSAQSQLELLDLLTSSSSISEDEISNRVKSARTIREQLKALVTDDDVEEITIPLGKRFRAPTYDLLTTSQKRNIRRQNYLNQVGERNDTTLFTGIALFVILPPAVILGVAIATGYVDLLP